MVKTPVRHYYAASWPYGRGCTTGDHRDVHAACAPVAFESKPERDAWVDNGGRCDGYGNTLPARDAVTLSALPYGWSRDRFVSEAMINYENMNIEWQAP